MANELPPQDIRNIERICAEMDLALHHWVEDGMSPLCALSAVLGFVFRELRKYVPNVHQFISGILKNVTY